MLEWLYYLNPELNSGGNRLEPSELARRIVDLTEEKLATNIVLLDLREVSLLADYFVICTVGSERQTRAVIESVDEGLRKEGIKPAHIEGDSDSGWVLMDYSDVILHVFAPEQRAFYGLEQFWRAAPVVVKIA